MSPNAGVATDFHNVSELRHLSRKDGADGLATGVVTRQGLMLSF